MLEGESMLKKCFAVLPFIFLFNIYSLTFLSNWSNAGTTYLLVRSNIRNYHKINVNYAGTISQVTLEYGTNLQDESLASTASVIIYTDVSGVASTAVGTLTFASQDLVNRTATYTGSVGIGTTGTYWLEIRQVGGNFYYRVGTALGDGSLWTFIYNDGFNYYPRIKIENPSLPNIQTVTSLNAAVNLGISPYLTRGGYYLDLSYNTITGDGQDPLTDLTGLDQALDGVDKSLVTYLNLSGNPITEIPANIFSTFTNLHVLDINNCTSLTTITGNAFNGLTVTGVVSIQNATALDTLSTNAFNGLTTQHLRLDQNSALSTIIPGAFSGLTVSGDLRLDYNSSLATIPSSIFDGLNIGKNLYINNCSGLATIQEGAFGGLTIGAHLLLNNNSSLVTISGGAFNDLTVAEDLFLDNTGITTVANGIFDGTTGTIVGKTVRFNNNTNLTTTENNALSNLTALHVRFDNNSSLSTVTAGSFNGLVTTGDVRFDNSNFTTLPENLFNGATIGGNLFFNGVNLTSVHYNTFNGATIGGFLDFTGHPDGLSLPTAITTAFTVFGY